MDDGAVTIQDSLDLITREIENEVDTVVLTPHFDPYRDSLSDFIKKRNERFEQLNSCINDKNIDITIIYGSETLYSELLLYYESLRQLCIKGTKYLLIEFPHSMKFDKNFFNSFEWLIEKFDIIPIIAHIEVYDNIKKKIDIIKKFRDLKCIIQVNADNFLNSDNDKFFKKLFDKNYIDIIASDCHNLENRNVNITEAMNKLKENYGVTTYETIINNQYKIINKG